MTCVNGGVVRGLTILETTLLGRGLFEIGVDVRYMFKKARKENKKCTATYKTFTQI